MATRRLVRFLKLLTGKRTDPLHPAIHDAAKAIRKAERAIKRIEREMQLGEATLVAVASRIQ